MSLTKFMSGVLGLLGINPRAFLALGRLPKYLLESIRFRRLGGQIDVRYPVLIDYTDAAGVMKGHYFHQDLYVAQKVFNSKPKRHVDVGSRIDGFVAHVASFREIEVLDIRPIKANSRNIKFSQWDLMVPEPNQSLSDSLSCLHTLEHFGLGRYGDPLDPEGHLKGFQNLIAKVATGGTFYLSFPISSRERVEFNAHRVFNPKSPLTWPGSEELLLMNFAFVDDVGDLHVDTTVDEAVDAELSFGCGIYTFAKI
jgi:hypothetical protein